MFPMMAVRQLGLRNGWGSEKIFRSGPGWLLITTPAPCARSTLGTFGSTTTWYLMCGVRPMFGIATRLYLSTPPLGLISLVLLTVLRFLGIHLHTSFEASIEESFLHTKVV